MRRKGPHPRSGRAHSGLGPRRGSDRPRDNGARDLIPKTGLADGNRGRVRLAGPEILVPLREEQPRLGKRAFPGRARKIRSAFPCRPRAPIRPSPEDIEPGQGEAGFPPGSFEIRPRGLRVASNADALAALSSIRRSRHGRRRRQIVLASRGRLRNHRDAPHGFLLRAPGLPRSSRVDAVRQPCQKRRRGAMPTAALRRGRFVRAVERRATAGSGREPASGSVSAASATRSPAGDRLRLRLIPEWAHAFA